MQDTVDQLKQVRRRARLWLGVLYVMRFVAALVAVAIGLGFVDWVLNLPGWLRLMIGLAVCAECVFWLMTRLLGVVRFNPRLSELALRAERMYPQLAGVLASSVEFAVQTQDTPTDTGPRHSAALAGLAVRRARELLEGVRLSRLIDTSHTTRQMGIALAALLVLGGVVASAPGASQTAAKRWLMPLGTTQWPRTVSIEDKTGLDVWPVDAPARLAAAINRGQRPGLRVNVHYRLTDAQGETGPWQWTVMTQQAAGSDTASASFERLIDIPPDVVRSLNNSPGGRGVLSYYLQAGDGNTPTAKIALVARPAVVAVNASIRAPVYAAGLAGSQDAALHEQSGQIASASALVGSSVRLTVVFNKPISITQADLPIVLPGLIDAIGMDGVTLVSANDSAQRPDDRIAVDFRLAGTMTTHIRIADEHGLENRVQRRYRIEAIEDRPPSVSMTKPSADEAVLATAKIDVAATAQDDVGLERLELLGWANRRSISGDLEEQPLPTLAEHSGRQANLNASALLDLSPMKLRAGDTVVLAAVAHDVFELDGRRHDPVRSTPRTLRIIDEPTMIAQMRTELAGLRQQVVRLEQTQQRIESEQPPSVTQPQQAQVTRRLESQASLLESLSDRAQRNRLDDGPMRELIRQAGELVQQARRRSSDAASRLSEADERPDETEELQSQAHKDQQAVRESLTELADLLDQGRDVLTLKLQLQQLKTQQQSLATDTRGLLPKTIGQDKDQLDEAQRQRIDELNRRQKELAEQARALTRQMQATADALARQGERDQDRAAAEALAEAAAIGQRQGLTESMQGASRSIQENQLSQAGQQQDRAMDALDRMIREMGTQEKRRQAILRRRLQELTQLIRKLLGRQVAQVSVLERVADDAVPALEPDQVTLRRATMGAQHQAGGSPEAAQVKARLADAVSEQGSAVGALRLGDRPPALTAENTAAEHLRSALKELEKVVKDNALEEARKQRQQLRTEYEQHASGQEALRQTVQGIADAGPMDRKRRAELVALAGDQSQLQRAISDTGKKVGQTLVFQHMHERIGSTSSRVVNRLRRGVGDEPVWVDQRLIALTLKMMAEALKEDPNDDPFAGGGGGGGGGGGETIPLVPPLAELKLIRGVQELVYDQTRSAEASLAGQPDGPMKQKMLELSTRQRELAGLGERLIKKMNERSQPGASPALPPEVPEAPEVSPEVTPESPMGEMS